MRFSMFVPRTIPTVNLPPKISFPARRGVDLTAPERRGSKCRFFSGISWWRRVRFNFPARVDNSLGDIAKLDVEPL
jgi:hypothetical protein